MDTIRRVAFLLAGMWMLDSPLAAQELAPDQGDPASGQYAVGMVARDYADPERRNWQDTGPRPIKTIVWYPAAYKSEEHAFADPHGLFRPLSVAHDAKIAISSSRYPLLLLSHGTSGDPISLLWLAHAFASRGYIVAGIYHHGDTPVEEHRPPQGKLHFWERALDVSAALDHVLDDPLLGPHIDPDRIGAAGFSAGGGTMLLLAGAMFRPNELAARCEASPSDPACYIPPAIRADIAKINELAKTDPVVKASVERRERSFRDRRIRAVFSMAPALGDAFTETGLSTVEIPVLIAASRADEITPLASNAQKYADLIPSATLTVVPETVSHYGFINECTEPGKRESPLICKDPPHVNRAELHRRIADDALDFFDGIWSKARSRNVSPQIHR